VDPKKEGKLESFRVCIELSLVNDMLAIRCEFNAHYSGVMRQAGDFATGCRFPYQCGTVLTSRGQIATIAWVECQRRDPRAVGGEAALPALAEDAHGLGLRRCGRRAVHPVPARPIRRSAPAMAPALAKGRCGGEPSPLDQGTDLRLLQRAARCLGEGRHQRALLPVPYPKIPIGRIPAARPKVITTFASERTAHPLADSRGLLGPTGGKLR
jgi:hypothetical protein